MVTTNLNITIQNLVQQFNDILNQRKPQKSIDGNYLRLNTFDYLQSHVNFMELQLTTAKGSMFEIRHTFDVTHELCQRIPCEIRLEFKIAATRTDKTKWVSNMKKQYVYSTKTNPVSFYKATLQYNVPHYGFEKPLHNKIKRDGYTYQDIKDIRVTKQDSIASIMDEIQDYINGEKFTNIVKEQIVMPVVKRAMIYKDYHGLIHFDQYVNADGQFIIDKLWTFVTENNMLE